MVKLHYNTIDKQYQIAGLEKSQLDLNGVTPEKYLDNLPR
jgi:hypothetical protein